MIRRLILLVLVVLGPAWLVRDSLAPRPLVAIVATYRYSLLAWEVQQLPKAVFNLLGSLGSDEASARESAREVVRAYFGLEPVESASSPLSGVAQRATVEQEIARSIAQTIEEEGLASYLGPRPWGLKVVFPPVWFALDSLPHILIISPRERIKLEQTFFLTRELDVGQMEDIEARVTALGLSGLVERLGGVATYPSLVPVGTSLERTVQTVAHEWVHQFLIFRPLGQRYWQSEEMTTINETAADMVGRELAWLTLRRRYGIRVPEDREEVADREEAGRFSFNREMRQIRQTVDSYLAQGSVDLAEAYMQQRQRYLAERGFVVRKLNQAYFAFHGTYAESPASASPVAKQLRILRQRSSSLRDFVYRVSRITTPEELARLAQGER